METEGGSQFKLPHPKQKNLLILHLPELPALSKGNSLEEEQLGLHMLSLSRPTHLELKSHKILGAAKEKKEIKKPASQFCCKI